MMRHRDDLDEGGSLKIDDAKRKFMEEVSSETPENARPPPRCFGNAGNGLVELDEKGIRRRWAACEVPSTCSLRLVCGKWMQANWAVSHAEPARGGT